LLVVLTTTVPAFAETEAGDKSGYTLFDPTPRMQMRDLSTDRPDTTESPYSVDAGHVQFETEPLSVALNKSEGVETTVLSSSVNAKVGLTNATDLQLIMEAFPHVSSTEGDVTSKASGLGDVTARFKLNLWGNDGGPGAAALMPFVTVPTHNRDVDPKNDFSYGLIAPFGTELLPGWGLGGMLEVDLVRNLADDGHALVFVQTVTVARDLAGPLGGFVELVHSVGAEDATGEAYFDGGLTLGVGPDIQFDAGANVGLSPASEDLRLFLGATFRR
jgi:hypothetical protein